MLKYALLALLRQAPAHGYDLRASFTRLLGGLWEVNAGQVYTTLGRLERDGLATSEQAESHAGPDRKVFRLTDEGRKDLDEWIDAPSDGLVAARSELFLKVVVRALLAGDGGSLALIDAHRSQRVSLLAAIEDRRAELRNDPSSDGLTDLILDGTVRHLEADLAWLDHVESEMARSQRKDDRGALSRGAKARSRGRAALGTRISPQEPARRGVP